MEPKLLGDTRRLPSALPIIAFGMCGLSRYRTGMAYAGRMPPGAMCFGTLLSFHCHLSHVGYRQKPTFNFRPTGTSERQKLGREPTDRFRE